MRILVLTSSFPRYSGDIAGCFVLEHSLELVKAGHSVHVMAWRDGAAAKSETPAGLEVSWVEHAAQDSGLFFADGAPENLEKDPTRAVWIVPAIVSMLQTAWKPALDADLIIGHWLVPSGLLARILGQLLTKPSLVIGHSGGVHALARLPSWLGHPLARFIAKGPTTLTTEPLRRKLAGLTDVEHVKVLPMGFHPAQTSGIRERPFEAVVMGRLVPIKNTELAIKAVLLSTSCTHLHILGDGPERPRLEGLADPGRITFHGILRGEAKAKILSRSRVCLFPSVTLGDRHEGLPVSLLECVHAGAVPVIGDIPGSEEFILSAIQRPEMTPESWSRSIDVLLQNAPSDELQKRVAPYTWARLGPVWADVVESITQASS